jgi:hypothetical protein
MNVGAATAELVQSYESLRSQATGQIPTSTPRGLALLLSSGMPAWMAACAPVMPPATPAASSGAPARPLVGLGADLVRLLTEMALGGLRRCEV